MKSLYTGTYAQGVNQQFNKFVVNRWQNSTCELCERIASTVMLAKLAIVTHLFTSTTN